MMAIIRKNKPQTFKVEEKSRRVNHSCKAKALGRETGSENAYQIQNDELKRFPTDKINFIGL